MDELTSLLKSLDELNKSVEFAYKYGPYFFAIFLLIVAPFVWVTVFKRWIGNSTDKRLHDKVYGDVRVYLRATFVGGIACVLIGVLVWVYENYHRVDGVIKTIPELKAQIEQLHRVTGEKKYTVAGMITNGIGANDEFQQAISDMTIVFSRLPATNSVFFLILSDDKIPDVLDFLIPFGQFDPKSNVRTPLVMIPLRVTVRKGSGIGSYRFLFDDQQAKLQPL